MLDKKKKPKFLRQEWFRHPGLGKKWRAPKGKQSKLRQHFKDRGPRVSIGYRNPVAIRGLHPSGLRDVLVSTVAEVERVSDAGIRMAASVGMKKRILIMEVAKKRGLRVFNPQRVEKKKKGE